MCRQYHYGRPMCNKQGAFIYCVEFFSKHSFSAVSASIFSERMFVGNSKRPLYISYVPWKKLSDENHIFGDFSDIASRFCSFAVSFRSAKKFLQF